MRIWIQPLAVVMAMTVFAGPLCADTVPARKAAKESAPVKERLTTLGVETKAAESQVATLTAGEVKFFGTDTNRIQVVGRQQDFFSGQSVNLWYESAAGAMMLALGFGLGYYMIHNRE